jgi:hypothetical protein
MILERFTGAGRHPHGKARQVEKTPAGFKGKRFWKKLESVCLFGQGRVLKKPFVMLNDHLREERV